MHKLRMPQEVEIRLQVGNTAFGIRNHGGTHESPFFRRLQGGKRSIFNSGFSDLLQFQVLLERGRQLVPLHAQIQQDQQTFRWLKVTALPIVLLKAEIACFRRFES